MGRRHQSLGGPQQGEGHQAGVSLLERGVVGAGRGLADLPDWLVHLHTTNRILETSAAAKKSICMSRLWRVTNEGIRSVLVIGHPDIACSSHGKGTYNSRMPCDQKTALLTQAMQNG